MSDRSQDMLCKALDLAEQAIAFYDETLASCSGELSKEVFGELKQDKIDHTKRIQDIHAGLVKGESWEDTCTLPEEEERALFAALAQKYEGETCPLDELEALERAVGVEQKVLDFYENEVKKAESDTEKAFLSYMVQEARAHHSMVQDMYAYYEDPEGWAMNGAVLDGA